MFYWAPTEDDEVFAFRFTVVLSFLTIIVTTAALITVKLSGADTFYYGS